MGFWAGENPNIKANKSVLRKGTIVNFKPFIWLKCSPAKIEIIQA